MCDSECETECKAECKAKCVRGELKKLSPEERVRLLQEIHIEEAKAEEEKIMSDPMFPIKSSMANMAREIENLKKQIEVLKTERRVIITNTNPLTSISSMSKMNMDMDESSSEEDCCEGFSWWPIILFFLFIIITSSIGGGSITRCPAMPKFHMD